MADTPTPAWLPSLVEKGLRLIDGRLDVSPEYGMYHSIRAQLQFIQRTIVAGAKPTDDEVDRLTLGIYAARELETTDPELADVLFEVEYLFKRL
jgi:Tsi6